MTEWKAYGEVVRAITSLPQSVHAKALVLYSVSTLLTRGRTLSEYENIEGLAEVCPISKYSKKFLGAVNAASFLSDDEKSMLALSAFYHRDFLIDIGSTNVDAVMEIVNRLVLRGSLIFPDRHGRELYDIFNERYSNQRLDFLPADQVAALNAGLPNGVFQVGRLVVGPLGILVSSEGRMLPPDKKVPLWHCSDPGCGVIHLVELHNKKSKIVRARAEFRKVLADAEGPASDWASAFSYLSRTENEGRYFDVVPLLIDGFDDTEKRLLFTATLDRIEGKSFRDIIDARIGKGLGRGASEKVAAHMSGRQIVHLLATLSTGDLVRILDSQILSEKMVIPRSEVRKLKTLVPKRVNDMSTEISSLGVRSVKREPAAFLSAVIFSAYQKSGNINDLSWRCKTSEASSATILLYMSEMGPRQAVNNLVMPYKEVFEYVCASLNLEPVQSSTVNFEDIILWKSGFSVARYDEYLSLFRTTLSGFNDAILASPSKANDLDREKIRAAAINSFVYTERFIEELIGYNIWYLTSDHFGVTKFQYRSSDAIKQVSAVIGDTITAGGATFSWNQHGGNTLGVLLVYGRAACDLLEKLISSDRKVLSRAEDDYPHYASARSRRFPFKHLQFWADADPKALREYLDGFSALIALLEKAKTAEIRNGVQHYRDKSKFPQKESMLECAGLLIRALDMADIANYIPKQYWAAYKNQDSFGISHWIMVDYNGRKETITLPFSSLGMAKPLFDKAYIIEGGGLLGQGAGTLIFDHRENSRFASLWEGYHHVVSVGRVDEEVLEN